MSSLRYMTLPGLLALVATLVLRMEAGEAEWLAGALLQATAHLRGLLPRLALRSLNRLQPAAPGA